MNEEAEREVDAMRAALRECEACASALCKVCGHEQCPGCVADDCDNPNCIDWNDDGTGKKTHDCVFERCAAHREMTGEKIDRLLNALDEKQAAR